MNQFTYMLGEFSDYQEPHNYIVPTVIEKRNGRERAYDIYSRLLKDRIIFVAGPIFDGMANAVVAQLLFCQGKKDDEPIHMYINSPGGVITSGMAILDTMQYVTAPIHTYCIGQAASMGAILLAMGDKRYSLPRARVMIHQPLGGARGQASDIEIQAREILRIKKDLNQMIADRCGMSLEEIDKATDRDNFLSAEEALKMNLIDEIVETVKMTPSEDEEDDEQTDE